MLSLRDSNLYIVVTLGSSMITKKDEIKKTGICGFMENSFDEGTLSILEMSGVRVSSNKYEEKISQ